MVKEGVTFLLALAFSLAASAAPITGAWYSSGGGQSQSTAVSVFLSDGRFMLIDDGNPLADPSGEDGLEKGIYTSDSITGAFSLNIVINTNGEWGFCNVPSNTISCAVPLGTLTVSATDTTLTLTTPEGTFQASRLTDPASPIVGAWYVSNGPGAQDLTVVAFLPDGRTMIGIDPPLSGFIEFGTYTWNPLTGGLTVTISTSNAPPGSSLNLSSFTSANIANGTLVLSSDSGTLALDNAAVPEPSSLLLIVTGLGGVLLRRRMLRSHR